MNFVHGDDILLAGQGKFVDEIFGKLNGDDDSREGSKLGIR